MLERLERMPLPLVPTMVGALTLSNVYGGMGYTAVRHMTMIAATIIMILYIIKIIKYPSVVKAEYSQVVPQSLYAAFFMAFMILGSYYYEFNQTLGLIVWGAATIGDAIHVTWFFVKNGFLKRNINTTLPSWFVTSNGILVSCVVGSGFGFNGILKYIVIWGILIYLILIPIMIYRCNKYEVPDGVYHTMAIALAPCSLDVVGLLNVFPNPNVYLLSFLYLCVLATTIFIIVKLPKFFRYEFAPSFAGITFPLAIGIVASNKMSAYLINVVGNETLGGLVKQVAGIQLYLTSLTVGFVLVNFIIMALGLERKKIG